MQNLLETATEVCKFLFPFTIRRKLAKLSKKEEKKKEKNDKRKKKRKKRKHSKDETTSSSSDEEKSDSEDQIPKTSNKGKSGLSVECEEEGILLGTGDNHFGTLTHSHLLMKQEIQSTVSGFFYVYIFIAAISQILSEGRGGGMTSVTKIHCK